MSCFISVPCPRQLKMDENVKKRLLELFTFIVSDENITIKSIQSVTSTARTCAWEVEFDHSIRLEYTMVDEGGFIGLEQFISNKLQEQKPMNIEDCELIFYDEKAGRITFKIKCDCRVPDFLYLPKYTEEMDGYPQSSK